jgi:hypothetical protein
LLKRRSEPRLLARGDASTLVGTWNEWLEPPDTDGWQLVSMDTNLSMLGRLRSVLLRPPPYQIEFELDDGTVKQKRLSTATARLPFVFQPYLETGLDVYGHEDGRPERRIVRFRLVTEPQFESCFESETRFKFEPIASLR